MRVIDFPTTAARLAYAWTYFDVNNVIANDLQNGRAYFVRAEGAGANRMVALPDVYCYIEVALNDFFKVDGAADTDALNAAGNGGKLAADTTPILLGDAAQGIAIQWAAGNADPIGVHKAVPREWDGTRAASILATTRSAGTTNPGSLSVNTYWDGGSVVTDTVTGAANTTATEYTGTIAAADMPDEPKRVTITVVPATHATDAIDLCGFVLQGYRK
jgi:hypothetical protein